MPQSKPPHASFLPCDPSSRPSPIPDPVPRTSHIPDSSWILDACLGNSSRFENKIGPSAQEETCLPLGEDAISRHFDWEARPTAGPCGAGLASSRRRRPRGCLPTPWRSPAWGGGRLATPTRTPRRSVVGRICRTGDQRKSRTDDTRRRVGYVPVPPHLSTMLPPLGGPLPHMPLLPVSMPMPSSPLLMSVCISSETIRNTSSRFGERAGERGDDHHSRGEVGWASA